jgi:hypothetical protein
MRPAIFRTLACLAALLALAGCRKPGQVRPDDPRYPVLEDLYKTGRELKPQAQAGLPLSFDPVEIAAEQKRKTTLYTATLSWEPSGDDAEVLAWLKRRVAAKRPGLARGALASTFTVVLTYRDSGGEPCATETIEVAVARPRGSVSLVHLGDEGVMPHTVTAAPGAVAWQEADLTVPFLPGQSAVARANERRQLTPQAPANLPLRFEDVNLDPREARPVALSWKLVADWQTFYDVLERATEKGHDTTGRKTKGLVVLLTYRDARGPVGTEKATLDVSGAQGGARLARLDRRHRAGDRAGVGGLGRAVGERPAGRVGPEVELPHERP